MGERLLRKLQLQAQDEFLNPENFYSIKQLRVLAERWRVHYNTVRTTLLAGLQAASTRKELQFARVKRTVSEDNTSGGDMPKPSLVAEQIRTNNPEIWKAFNSLAQACHNAGPLDEKTRRLVKLAIAVGAGTEGGTHSAVRHAAEAGVTAEEMEHVVLLSITTTGFPAAGRALSWIHDKTQ